MVAPESIEKVTESVWLKFAGRVSMVIGGPLLSIIMFLFWNYITDRFDTVSAAVANVSLRSNNIESAANAAATKANEVSIKQALFEDIQADARARSITTQDRISSKLDAIGTRIDNLSADVVGLKVQGAGIAATVNILEKNIRPPDGHN